MFCWDNKIEFYWNQNIYGNFRHSLSVLFEIQDDDKKLLKYESKEVTLFETDEMISFDEKMALFAQQSTQDKIQEVIAAAKLEYANYTME